MRTHALAATSAPASAPAAGLTARILPAVWFTFVCYLSIGMLLAVLPAYVHLRLGLGPVAAGVLVSAQYAATLATRPLAGRMSDLRGPRASVLHGLAANAIAGATCLLAPWLEGAGGLAVAMLLTGRLALGAAESLGSTGATLWGVARVGHPNLGRVISWNGMSTYGALAAGAPLGVLLEARFGFGAIGGVTLALSTASVALALWMEAPPAAPGRPLALRRILGHVAPHGIGLALASAGFGVLAAFVTLFYAERAWSGAAAALSAYGICFMGGRLLFSGLIDRRGGYPIALVSLGIEALGLVVLALAPSPVTALSGAALTGLGFSAVFPALGVEAVRDVPVDGRGAALGVYTAFLDLSLFASGPGAGALIAARGYPAGFLAAAAAVVFAFGLAAWLAHARVGFDLGSWRSR
jgi:MFS family permease